MKLLIYIAVSFLVLVIAVIVVGRLRWDAATSERADRLLAAVPEGTQQPITREELEALPAPVARYFREVLPFGQQPIRYAHLTFQGRFLMQAEKGEEGYRRFTAEQHITAEPPGFVWDARIRMAPGMTVTVRDGFVGGEGSMHGALWGLITMVHQEGDPEIAAGSLSRYLAEAVWVPTALLPRHGVRWSEVDDSRATATLSAGGTTVSAEFRFGADGRIESVYVPDRLRDVDGEAVPTPWEGFFRQYERREGVWIPISGDVSWILPEGRQTYWIGEITAIRYELFPSP